jgi:protein-tyrosine kinase
MSRINEALRRAAEEPTPASDATRHAVAQATAPTDLDVDVLKQESFPGEASRSDAAGVPASAPPPISPAPATPPTPSAPSPPSATSAAFATLDRVTHLAEKVVHRRSTARVDSTIANKLVVSREIEPGSVEQYRRLAGTLHRAQESHGIKVVMVSSAVQGEGKTLTASNLALTFSESYHRQVLLIDGDLRRPTLHTIFHVSNTSGLSNLTGSKDGRLLVREASPRLSILTAGQATNDPMAGLTSERMKRVIEEARANYDWVIIDTPPVVLLSDANLLSAMVDGAVLVVKADSTPYDLVSRAVAALDRTRILGVVLNAAEHQHSGYAYYSYGESEPQTVVNRT